MTYVATIKVPRVVRDRVRDAARAAHLTQGQLMERQGFRHLPQSDAVKYTDHDSDMNIDEKEDNVLGNSY